MSLVDDACIFFLCTKRKPPTRVGGWVGGTILFTMVPGEKASNVMSCHVSPAKEKKKNMDK